MATLRRATLDAKQRGLAKRLVDLRQRLLHLTENERPNRQVLQQMKAMDNALAILRGAARKLQRIDNRLFLDVIDVIKSLQGDLSTKR